jgi:hypothetical protein
MGEKRNMYRLLVGKPEGRRDSKDRDVDGRITLRWILLRYVGVVWTGLVWLRLRTSGELL